MPIFNLQGKTLSTVKLINFKSEKELQSLVESNLETVFNCRFIATEFSTGSEHNGRIDTLALSEDNNPVIIEYKKVASSELINQSLYYLAWLRDHRGDYEVACQKALGKDVEIDWTEIRVICLAPEYKKYDLHAAKVMGANIELWQYKFFDNGSLYIEDAFRKSSVAVATVRNNEGKNPVMVEAGRKAAIAARENTYTVEEHLEVIEGDHLKKVCEDLMDFIVSLDESIEEVPKKFYIAYKVAQNFVCLQSGRAKLTLFLKLDPSTLKNKPENSRDVREIGHYGTGDFEISISTRQHFEEAKKFIRMAFEAVGG